MPYSQNMLGREREREKKKVSKVTLLKLQLLVSENVERLFVTLKNRKGVLLVNIDRQFMLSKL